jgi:hypothetical protein
VADATVGVIANPMPGRDIRRLVASASVFPNAEKASMVVRLTAAAGALGVGRVLVSTDTFGVSAAVLRESRRRAEAGDPPDDIESAVQVQQRQHLGHPRRLACPRGQDRRSERFRSPVAGSVRLSCSASSSLLCRQSRQLLWNR